MNCHKCGTKTRVIESREKNGDTRRREYCPTCRFASTRLVPNGIRVIRSGYNPSSMKMFLSAEDGKEYVIEDIRGSAQVWTENWKKRLLACKNHELDAAGKDLREMWPRASKNYCTRREDHWHDEKYREELLSAIVGMAQDRIARWEAKSPRWEAKSPTVPSPKTAEERQAREAKRPQGRPGDWWLEAPIGKPPIVEPGQRWLRYDREPVVITQVSAPGRLATYRPIHVMSSNVQMNYAEISVILLLPDDGQWKFFGYEPGQEPKKELAKPDTIRVGQKWEYNPKDGYPVRKRTVHSINNGWIHFCETGNSYPADDILSPNSEWTLVSEPESIKNYGVPDGYGGLVKIKPGQKWRCKDSEYLYIVKEINKGSDGQIRVTFEENGWDFARVMLNGTYELVSEPEQVEPQKQLYTPSKMTFKP